MAGIVAERELLVLRSLGMIQDGDWEERDDGGGRKMLVKP